MVIVHTDRPSRKKQFYADPANTPSVPSVNPTGIPDALKGEPRWVVWGWLWKSCTTTAPGKWDRPPLRPDGRPAKSNDPATWTTFDAALAAHRAAPAKFPGVGFVLGNGSVGIDLDDVRDPDRGDMLPWAADLIGAAGTFADVSPSSTGVKVIGRGAWTPDRHKMAHPEGGEIEVYDRQYFALTGCPAPGSVPIVADIQPALDRLADYVATAGRPGPSASAGGFPGGDDDLLDRAGRAKHGPAFLKLWRGDTTGHGGDTSAADLALVNRLAFWCGPNPHRIDGLFRRSGLMRSKWDERHGADGRTYGQMTVATALSGRTEFYSPTGSGASFGGSGAGPGSSSPPPGRPRFVPDLVCLADVVPVAVPWLWPCRIAVGRISVLNGRPGEGKSFVTCDLAARLSTGCQWPDGGFAPVGDTLLLCAEDDPADTIAPRLIAAGADRNRVHLLKAAKLIDSTEPDEGTCVAFDLNNIDLIRDSLARLPQCKLIVVDPIGSYLGGQTDAHRDNEVRAVLTPLAALASEVGVAVLLVCHTRKAAAGFADDTILGSRAFSGIARTVMHLSADADDRERKLLLPGKSNLGATPAGLAFRIAGESPRVEWEETPLDGMHADDVMAGADDGGGSRRRRADPGDDGESPRRGPKPEARNRAAEWLARLLGDGPMFTADVRRQVTEAGLAWATVRRALETLDVTPRKTQFDGGWVWGLPGDDRDARTCPGGESDAPTCSNSDAKPPTAESGEQPEHLRETSDEQTANSQANAEGAQVVEKHEHLRPRKRRRCSSRGEPEHLRGNPGETADVSSATPEGAQVERVSDKCNASTDERSRKHVPSNGRLFPDPLAADLPD